MPPGSFSFWMNVEGWVDEHGVRTVKIPVDIVIKPCGAASGDLPSFVETQSAGDFTNVNKRRKEEAAKAGLGPRVHLGGSLARPRLRRQLLRDELGRESRRSAGGSRRSWTPGGPGARGT